MSCICKEHKLIKGDKQDRNIRMIWKRDNFLSMEASTSDDAKDRRQGVGRGGKAMCFHPRLHPVIFDKGLLAKK